MTIRPKLTALTAIALFALLAGLPAAVSEAQAATGQEIDAKVDAALKRFRQEVAGGSTFLNKSVGVLVFPEVVKIGFVFGGEYGEGALRVDGRTVDYYSSASFSVGFQAGFQAKTVILVFLERDALGDFMSSNGWEAGVDGSVAVVEWGVGKDLTTTEFDSPVVGFVFGNVGLMANINLEGSKYTKLVR